MAVLLISQTLGHGGLPGPAFTVLVVVLLVIWGGGGVAGIASVAAGFREAQSAARIVGAIAVLLSFLWLVGCFALLATSSRPLGVAQDLFISAPWGWIGMIPGILGGVGTMLARRSTANIDRCMKCDYDLRGSQHSTTCPECGEPIAKPARK